MPPRSGDLLRMSDLAKHNLKCSDHFSIHHCSLKLLVSCRLGSYAYVAFRRMDVWGSNKATEVEDIYHFWGSHDLESRVVVWLLLTHQIHLTEMYISTCWQGSNLAAHGSRAQDDHQVSATTNTRNGISCHAKRKAREWSCTWELNCDYRSGMLYTRYRNAV